MADDRPWYREPETFIAVAALVVSITAVVVGIYEAQLQRAHDRAEVWPHVEIATYSTSDSATVQLRNDGLGPALIKSMVVTVDGRRRAAWPDAVGALLGSAPVRLTHFTVVGSAVRAGDHATLITMPASLMPRDFWDAVRRVDVQVCYASVFGQFWLVTDTLGTSDRWREVAACPAQPDGTEF